MMTVAEIVARGGLRLGIFPSFMYTEAEDGTLRGIAVEIARAMAERLHVSPELSAYRSPPDVVEALARGSCDVGMLGIDPGRAGAIDFTAPLMRADFTYLVPAGSGIQRIADTDRAGVRIAVVRNHAMDFALRGKLAEAAPVHVDVPDEAFELLASGAVDVCAGIRPGLLAYAKRLPGSLVLSERYGANTLALAAARGNTELLAWLQSFVAEAKTSGLARQAIERAGLSGIDIPAD